MMKILSAAAVTAMGLWVAGSADAATCSQGPVTYTVETGTTVACDSGNQNAGSLLIGSTTFTQGIDDTGSSTTDSPLSWGTDPMDVELGSGSLPWSINLASSWVGQVLMQLKQANSYALFDVTASCDFGGDVCSGTWSTSGPGNSENDLSNTRAYYATGDMPPVPLPAAGWMLLAGVGGLVAMRRRTKA